MDILEQSLDSSSQEKQEEEVVQASEDGTGEEHAGVTIASVQQAAAFGDHNIQYQFRTEGGQLPTLFQRQVRRIAGSKLPEVNKASVSYHVIPAWSGIGMGLLSHVSQEVTYRVVQVTDQHVEGRDDEGGAVSVVSTAAFTGAPQAVAQAVIQNPFSNGGSPAGEAVGGETRFAYFPATAVSDGTVSVQAATDPTLTQAGATGQFYVMMSPPDVLQTGTQRTIAPRTQPYPAKMDGPRTPRDERRRAQHNEVERRRRDKINNWIVTLSKIIPDCNMDSTKTGASKGGILSKACDYIRELRQSNQRLQESLKEVERIQMDNELCRQQIEELKNENALLRAQLQQHGIEMVGETPPQ